MSLTNSVNTNDGDWWLSGTIHRAPTMTATPARCHHTLTELSTETSRTPNRFNTACSKRIATKISIVFPGVGSKPHWRLANAPANRAAP